MFKDVGTKMTFVSLTVIAQPTKQTNKQRRGKNLNDHEWVSDYLNYNNYKLWDTTQLVTSNYELLT